MKISGRKLLFYFLVLLFFILTPLLILYSFGYQWDPHRKTIAKTGVIALKSFPEDAAITLNGELTNKKTPANLSLFPGSYALRLERDNFWPYEKVVTLQSDQVIRMENILLFPKELPAKNLLRPPSFQQMTLSPKGDRILFLSKKGGEDNFYLLEIPKKTLQSLGEAPEGFLAGEEELTFNWSQDGEIVLVSSDGSQFILFPDHPDRSFLLEEWLKYSPDKAAFSQRDNQTLFILHQGRLLKLDLRRQKITRLPLKNITDFIPTSRGLFFLKAGSDQVFSSNEKGKDLALAGDLKKFTHRYPLRWRSSVPHFLSLKQERWGVLDAEDNFYGWNPSWVYPGVKDFRFSPAGDKILLWNDYEIWVMEPGSERRVIDEFEEGILDAFWHPESQHFFFLNQQGLWVREIAPGESIIQHLVYPSAEYWYPDSWQWVVNEEVGILYFYGKGAETESFQAIDLALGFLDPFMLEFQERMDSLKERLQLSSWTLEKTES